MRSKAYQLLIAIGLILFVALLLWPEFALRSLVELERRLGLFPPAFREASTAQENIDQSSRILQNINFDISVSADAASAAVEAPPEQNRLIIPRIGVDAEVIISDNEEALGKGLWHIPGSALPGGRGNIVISGHRWLFKPPSKRTFYDIDKIKIGDPLYYAYGDKRYEYRVTDLAIVNPEDVQILAQDEDKLTLFTCHPLFSTKQRYVVTATLQRIEAISVFADTRS